MGSSHRDAEDPIPISLPLPSLPLGSTEDPEIPPETVNRASRADPPPATVRGAAEKGGAGSRAVAWILRKERRTAAARSGAVGVRAATAALCLVAFAVMAADRNKGWALDSFDHYPEYRYLVSVNVIGFVYSVFQLFAHVHHRINRKHIIHRPTGYYFDFAMDQIMAYLLISASSSAASRTEEWVSNYGKDKFPNMASGSVAISFLAFIGFALSALISAYHLFTSDL